MSEYKKRLWKLHPVAPGQDVECRREAFHQVHSAIKNYLEEEDDTEVFVRIMEREVDADNGCDVYSSVHKNSVSQLLFDVETYTRNQWPVLQHNEERGLHLHFMNKGDISDG